MNSKAQEMTEEQYEHEASRKYHVAVVVALAEKMGRLATAVAVERPGRSKANNFTQEILTLQDTMPTALVELHNAIAVERGAPKN